MGNQIVEQDGPNCDCQDQDGSGRNAVEGRRASGQGEQQGKEKKGKMMLYVIIIGAIVLVALTICSICYCCKRKSNTNVVDNRSPRENTSNNYFCCKKRTETPKNIKYP